jgi:hypothetical protein
VLTWLFSIQIKEKHMTVPGLPVMDPGDAEVYGWRIEPDAQSNLWLRVLDGTGSVCFRPGTHITHDSGGKVRGNAQITGLEGSVDQDGNAWLSEGGQVTDESVALTPNIHAIIFAPGGFLRWEGRQLLHQGIEFADRINPGPTEPDAPNT